MNSKPEPVNDEVSVRYDKAAITYATQFLISPSDEELLLDFSSGIIQQNKGDKTLSVHTRLALPWSAATRLAKLLNKVVAQNQQQTQEQLRKAGKGDATQAGIPAASIPQASLPQLSTD